MIKVELLECKEDAYFNKNGTFTKDKIYLSRSSKIGKETVALSNEGYWTSIRIVGQLHYSNRVYEKAFKARGEMYFKNNDELNDFIKKMDSQFNMRGFEYNLSNNIKDYITFSIKAELQRFNGMPNEKAVQVLMEESMKIALSKFVRGE